eukprot:7387579-Prymnesium_polylepis.1
MPRETSAYSAGGATGPPAPHPPTPRHPQCRRRRPPCAPRPRPSSSPRALLLVVALSRRSIPSSSRSYRCEAGSGAQEVTAQFPRREARQAPCETQIVGAGKRPTTAATRCAGLSAEKGDRGRRRLSQRTESLRLSVLSPVSALSTSFTVTFFVPTEKERSWLCVWLYVCRCESSTTLLTDGE